MMAYGALPLGHAHPSVVEAISEAAAGGTLLAAASQVEVEVAADGETKVSFELAVK